MNAPPKRREPRAGGSQRESGQQGTPNPSTEEPEHRNERRRFLIWACMAGMVGPERVTERILADVADATE